MRASEAWNIVKATFVMKQEIGFGPAGPPESLETHYVFRVNEVVFPVIEEFAEYRKSLIGKEIPIQVGDGIFRIGERIEPVEGQVFWLAARDGETWRVMQ